MEEEDTHLCLVCQETIVGLLNYVQHKKSGCHKKAAQTASSSQGQQGSVVNSQDFDLSIFQQDGQFSHAAADHAYTTLQQNARQSSSLNVDIASPLASFIDSAFNQAGDGAMDPGSVLDQEVGGSSEPIPDFFQSLELERKTGEKTVDPLSSSSAAGGGRSLRKRKGLPLELHADLPITTILSHLEFSSDEEMPMDDLGLDFDSWESEWLDAKPPQSHTGGKWKPGQGPKKYSPYQPTGGKWKPGQRLGTKQQRHAIKQAKTFYCGACKLPFTDRESYDEHLRSIEHKKESQLEEKSAVSAQVPEQDAPAIQTWVLDSTTGQMVEVLSSNNVEVHAPTLVKRGRDMVVKCDICNLFFDSVKVYDVHCETTTHKDGEEKKAQDLCRLMMSEADADKTQPANNNMPNSATQCIVKREVDTDESNADASASASSALMKTEVQEHGCVVCNKTFARKYELAYHLLTPLHMRRAFQHPRALEMLDRYSKYVIRLFPYQCTVCRFYFNRPSDLADHLLSAEHMKNCEDLVGPLMCVACKYRTENPDDMIHHIDTDQHLAAVKANKDICIVRECHSKITCKYCGVIMRSAVRMKRHVEYRHQDRKGQEATRVVWQQKEKDMVTCPDCSKTFFSATDMRVHYQRKHASRTWRCDPCGRAFCNLHNFQHHMGTRLHKKRQEEHGKQEQKMEKKQADKAEKLKKAAVSEQDVKQEKRPRGRPPKRKAEEEGKVVAPSPSPKIKKKEKGDESSLMVMTRRSRRSTKKPKKYTDYSSDDSAKKGSGDDEAEAVSKAIATVLQHEAEGGSSDAANSRLPVMDVGPGSNCGLEEVIGAIDMEENSEEEEDEEQFEENEEEDDLEGTEDDAKGLLVRMKEEKRASVKDSRMFLCKFCMFSGESLAELHAHALDNHPKETTRCEPCNLVFLTKMAYKVHCTGSLHQKTVSKMGATDEQFTCPHCDKIYPDETEKELHVEFVHLHVSSEEGVARLCQGRDMVTQLYGDHLKQIESLSYRAQVACPDCGKFFNKNGLVEHLRFHTNERPFKCRHCSKSFPSPSQLRRHLLSDHITSPLISCDECGKQFKKPWQYRDHQEIHKNKASSVKWPCNVCTAVFYLEKHLDAHVKRHGERKFKCKVEGCHYAFVLITELKEHMYTHTREKKFLCDICGHEEGTKTRMRRHEKSHDPVNLFPCEHCPYKAHSRSHLQRHIRIHIGSKPFKCLYCSYTCNTGGNMRKHILGTRKHEGLSLYPCKFCDYGCNEAKDFKQHLHQFHMEYVQKKASEPLVVFTGLYHPEDDMDKVPEGEQIRQVMKGRFVKVYDGTRVGSKGEVISDPKKKTKQSTQQAQGEGQQLKSNDIIQQALDKSASMIDDSNGDEVSSDTNDDNQPSLLISQEQPSPKQETIVNVGCDKLYTASLPWEYVTQSVAHPNSVVNVQQQPENLTWVPIERPVLDVGSMQQPTLQHQIQDLQVVGGNQVISIPAVSTTTNFLNNTSTTFLNNTTTTANFLSNTATISNLLGPRATLDLNSISSQLVPGATYQIVSQGAGGQPQTLSLRVLNRQ